MNILPAVHRDDGRIFSNGAVVSGDIEHLKIFRLDAFAFEFIAQVVDIYVPTAVNKQNLSVFQVVGCDQRFRAQSVRDGYSGQYLFIVHMCRKTAAL